MTKADINESSEVSP